LFAENGISAVSLAICSIVGETKESLVRHYFDRTDAAPYEVNTGTFRFSAQPCCVRQSNRSRPVGHWSIFRSADGFHAKALAENMDLSV
jgi:hypothetical protein